MRYIVWKNYKWYIIGFVIFVLLVLIIFLFVYSMPVSSEGKHYKYASTIGFQSADKNLLIISYKWWSNTDHHAMSTKKDAIEN